MSVPSISLCGEEACPARSWHLSIGLCADEHRAFSHLIGNDHEILGLRGKELPCPLADWSIYFTHRYHPKQEGRGLLTLAIASLPSSAAPIPWSPNVKDMQCRRMPPLAGWGTMKVRRPMSIGAWDRHRTETQGNAAGSELTRLAGIVGFRTFGALVHFPRGLRHGNRTCSSRQSGSGPVVPLSSCAGSACGVRSCWERGKT